MLPASDRAKRFGAVAAIAAVIATSAEGLRQSAYSDPVGILTVCYGHTGADIEKGKRYAFDECKEMLAEDMLAAVEEVERCHPNLPPNVHAAFSDAVFNIGSKVACDSTASRYLESGQIEAACRELPKWDKARVAGVLVTLPGLTKRRQREMQLCLS